METFRILLVVATVVGFGVTVAGLVAAYVSARREFQDAEGRVAKLEELSEAEQDESKLLAQRIPKDEVEAEANRAAAAALQERYRREYERHGLTRPTYSNLIYLAAYESRRLLGLVLSSTKRELLIAAFGLLVSTAASVGSLFLTT